MPPECVVCLDEIEGASRQCHVCRQMWCVACHSAMVRRHEEDADGSLDPCPYGAPRCPCGEQQGSCLRRPCHHSDDRGIMMRWERDAPLAHRQWVEDETVASLRRCKRSARKEGHGVDCPVCHAVQSRK